MEVWYIWTLFDLNRRFESTGVKGILLLEKLCDKRASAAYKVFLHTFVFELQGLWQFYLSSIISLSDTLGPKDIAKEY